MFYKFAIANVYPSTAAAQKAAALEITAMNAVIASGVPHLTIALTTLHLIDGQCVIATARAPLEQLVYGCANAGHRGCSEERHEGCAVENGSRCRQAVPAIRELAATMGLSEHAVHDRLGRRRVSMCLPVDIEVHVGRDGRLYLIDLARLMPPTPTPGWYGLWWNRYVGLSRDVSVPPLPAGVSPRIPDATFVGRAVWVRRRRHEPQRW